MGLMFRPTTIFFSKVMFESVLERCLGIFSSFSSILLTQFFFLWRMRTYLDLKLFILASFISRISFSVFQILHSKVLFYSFVESCS